MQCPCGSTKTYAECCEKYISGAALPATAEALMRSRYTAFYLHFYEYIAATMLPPAANHFNVEEAKRTADAVQWKGLQVINAGADTVEFRAHFHADGRDQVLHERSRFKRQDGKWYYISGAHHETGRNEHCPCGSKKKFKKCCGK